MQGLFVLIAIGLVVLAVSSVGDLGDTGSAFDAPRERSILQPIVLGVMAVLSVAAAFALQDGKTVRIPTPARLEELVGRAEATALERAEAIAKEQSATSAASGGTQPTE